MLGAGLALGQRRGLRRPGGDDGRPGPGSCPAAARAAEGASVGPFTVVADAGPRDRPRRLPARRRLLLRRPGPRRGLDDRPARVGRRLARRLHGVARPRSPRWAPSLLCPGHGPWITDPPAKIAEYAEHRRERERAARGRSLAARAGERSTERAARRRLVRTSPETMRPRSTPPSPTSPPRSKLELEGARRLRCLASPAIAVSGAAVSLASGTSGASPGSSARRRRPRRSPCPARVGRTADRHRRARGRSSSMSTAPASEPSRCPHRRAASRPRGGSRT